jgi:hypothetical protein
MNIALEQATNLRRGTHRTAVLPTAQPHAPARPAHTACRRACVRGADVRVFASHEQLLCLRHPRWLRSGDLKSPTNATDPKPLWLCSNPPPTQATNPLPSPPLTRHSETHRASGETPARFTPLPGARPSRTIEVHKIIDSVGKPFLLHCSGVGQCCSGATLNPLGPPKPPAQKPGERHYQE